MKKIKEYSKLNKQYYTIYLNEQGQLHREDGPAIEYDDCAKFWFLNGRRHREDGPACEWANGSREWYLEGKYYTEDGYYQEMKRRCVKLWLT